MSTIAETKKTGQEDPRTKAGDFLYLFINLTCMNEDFHCLDLRERADLILKQGQHLLTTSFYGASVKLYNLNTLLVEIYHHPVTRKIMRVSVAASNDLNKHLEKIRIR